MSYASIKAKTVTLGYENQITFSFLNRLQDLSERITNRSEIRTLSDEAQ